MKYLKLFSSTEEQTQVLATWPYNTVSSVIGKTGALISGGVEPGPDYSIPFYIEDISGSNNTATFARANAGTPLTIQTSTDGIDWTTRGQSSNPGLSITIPANSRLYIRCNTRSWSNQDGGLWYSNDITISKNCNVGGNILSLLYGSNFNGQDEFGSYASIKTFSNLFGGNTSKIVNAKDLLLPLDTKDNCYAFLFNGMTTLITAPVLPAAVLSTQCYLAMFQNCTNINHIKCLATDISASNCTQGWLNRVSAIGTFVKAAGVTWPEGAAGIPSGWTVQDAA